LESYAKDFGQRYSPVRSIGPGFPCAMKANGTLEGVSARRSGPPCRDRKRLFLTPLRKFDRRQSMTRQAGVAGVSPCRINIAFTAFPSLLLERH
jgi:hypothetical protein